MKRKIQIEVGDDDQLCAGCRYARKIGRNDWRCEIFAQWLLSSCGRPVRCRPCVHKQVPNIAKCLDPRSEVTT